MAATNGVKKMASELNGAFFDEFLFECFVNFEHEMIYNTTMSDFLSTYCGFSI